MSRLWWKWVRPTAFWLVVVWLGLAPLSSVLARPCACHQSAKAHACCAKPAPPVPKPDCNHCQLCQAAQPNPAV